MSIPGQCRAQGSWKGTNLMVARARTKPLRVIAESFVVAPPTGTSTLTRLNPTTVEADALRQIGTHLGQLFRADFVDRVQIGRVPAALNGRAARKRNLTAHTSSRWAGAITRAAEDQYQLGMRALADEVAMLDSAARLLRARLSVPLQDAAPVHATPALKPTRKAALGYRNASEKTAKTVRLHMLETRLSVATARRNGGHPRVVLGGGKLWRTRQNLAAAGMNEDQWRARWDAARMFLTADGETGTPFGNQTIRVESDGTVAVKVPADLVPTLGSKLRLTVPVSFVLRGQEWADRVARQQAIRYDITFDPDTSHWFLRASWSYGTTTPTPPLASLQAGRIIGVDLNADHLTAGIIDTSGNPVGVPAIIPLLVAGLPATVREGHLRAAITELLDQAETAGAGAIAIENLNFVDARRTGRETMGRGPRGKRFRRTVAGIPTGKFRVRLTAMAANRGIHIIAVDPAYTSRWGDQHWSVPLRQRTSDRTVTRHQAAAVAIGRRAHGHRIKRRADGIRTQQRMSPDPTATSIRNPKTRAPKKAETGPTRHRPPKSTG
jgi:hypothetical protein